MNLIEELKIIIDKLNEIDNYTQTLGDQLSIEDKKTSDLLHYIENNKLSAFECYRLIKEMKIIELLVRIANDKEVPKIIKYKDKIYKRQWGDYMGDEPIDEYYVNDDGESWFDDLDLTLDTEVEIVEEDKKIKKLEFEGGTIEDKLFLARYITHNRAKINELIDEVNKMKEGK